MRRVMLAFSLAAGMPIAACSSSSVSTTTPTSAKCGITATAAPASFSASGGNGTLTVSTDRECQWSAAAAGNWIQFGGATAGQGADTVPFKVAANADPSVRKGTITVGDQQVGINQDAAPCVFTVTPRADSVGVGGGQRKIAVTASSALCSWTASSNADWLTIVDGAKGTGTGEVTYAAAATTGPARTGSLQVGGEAITVTQASGCKYTIAPASQAFMTEGGSGSVSVSSGAACAWTAASQVPWVTLINGSGTGAGTITFSVAANAMGVPARSGMITVNDQTFTVSQAAGPPCVYRLGQTSQAFPAATAGAWSFGVFTAPACAWTASSSAPWVAITSGANGAGNGLVTFAVAPNPAGSPTRATTIVTTSGLIFTIIQDAAP
ncbi:MAG TPA: BACON domain-containing carbohydrate-binding protein [Vicinamibacterales bacterium]|nr:BACON domain-containing carbohydrate-binding protein [Vicinamibacterales bacterium]